MKTQKVALYGGITVSIIVLVLILALAALAGSLILMPYLSGKAQAAILAEPLAQLEPEAHLVSRDSGVAEVDPLAAYEQALMEVYESVLPSVVRQSKQRLRRWGQGEAPLADLLQPSGERAVPMIITGVLGNTHQYELAVNVPNAGYISNLPAWAIVEIPARVDAI
jgi:alpha-galactosidase/6-phospho-beta-glucosidase family protein